MGFRSYFTQCAARQIWDMGTVNWAHNCDTAQRHISIARAGFYFKKNTHLLCASFHYGDYCFEHK